MVKALKDKDIRPRIHVEDGADGVHFAVSCRHCDDALCLKSCIAGAISKRDGVVCIDRDKCVGCYYLRAGVPLWGPAPQRRRPHGEVPALPWTAPPGNRPACGAAPTGPSSLKKRRGVVNGLCNHRQFGGGHWLRGGHPPGWTKRGRSPSSQAKSTTPIPGP